jgi:hypothetical protein
MNDWLRDLPSQPLRLTDCQQPLSRGIRSLPGTATYYGTGTLLQPCQYAGLRYVQEELPYSSGTTYRYVLVGSPDLYAGGLR